MTRPARQGLYDPRDEHGACGVGFVASVRAERRRDIVEQGLSVLCRLGHRGGVGADPFTGDGAGILLQIPHALYARDVPDLPEPGTYAVGTLFLDPARAPDQRDRVERAVVAHGLQVLGWRNVPVDPAQCGPLALASRPFVAQVFLSGDLARLLPARKRVERDSGLYVCSWSERTVVYKGLLLPERLAAFYPDLADPDCVSAVALVHQRFSTNTFPSWARAHPYRLLAHNGEINTLRGNLNRMRAREARIDRSLRPLLDADASDSGMLDNALELLVWGGRSLPHAVAMAMPPAWESDPEMAPEVRAFHAWHGAAIEPWDGPALVAFCDGRVVGAALDRNGLRPARYTLTADRVVLASEAGVLDVPAAEVLRKGRLGPGQQLVVDLEAGGLQEDHEVKHALAIRRPYAAWLAGEEMPAERLPPAPAPTPPRGPELRTLLKLHGYTREDLRTLLSPMGRTGKEPTGSMGDDTPLAVLSDRPQPVFHYFRQQFAQVTNPPIDPLRERVVMSLRTLLGPERRLFQQSPGTRRRVVLDGPVLNDADLARLRASDGRVVTLRPALNGSLTAALTQLEAEAEAAARSGATIVVLSDRGLETTPVPSLLALGAVHQHLVRIGLRPDVSLVVESAEPREVMHVCLLLGYGATAVNPYGALAAVAELARERAGSEAASRKRYVGALHAGIRKVLSKMGISTVESYCGAQVFEALGLASEVVDRCFAGTSSRIGGVGFEILAEEARRRAPTDDEGLAVLDGGGEYRWRRDGEHHQYDPNTVGLLQHAVRSADYAVFKRFTAHVDARSAEARTLRGLLEPVTGGPIPLDEVESEVDIVRRFRTGAMSYGSLSKEAHENLAVAMNRLGARSNSGEGGEAVERRGTSRRSAVKQVASGRFGVTPHYLADADELQIKMAQGAKPGEGGQLPGHKVNDEIARTRCSTPGVTLISPPPHHDIYSIEDLAQLIFDLREANDTAEVSVKLVSEAGVGTVAAGVAKAGADRILLSGHSGGTGAAPLSSIKHAGVPWELGLAEAQQVLRLNGLRGRVRLEVDGQLKTGRDVVVAALLGAETFGFGTAALVASGCVLMRACHLNTCPVGIATQDPALRRLFTGQPKHVMNFMVFVAREVREWMARLGFRSIDEMVGRVDRLQARPTDHWKARTLDLDALLHAPGDGSRRWAGTRHEMKPDPLVQAFAGGPMLLDRTIRNTQRTVTTRLSSAVVRQAGAAGLPPGTVRLRFQGSAGQSFAAFLAPGIDVLLVGDANEAVGKGMAGGRLVVRPPAGAGFCAADNVVVGNVALYGATGGEAFINGRAGERFAVRNSGAVAVVEGVGAHGCEYMTRGEIVVLGRTGRNFAAGMSGGVAYVLDEDGRCAVRCNAASVGLSPLDEVDLERVYALVRAHYQATESNRAWRVMSDWAAASERFVKVAPHAATRRAEPAPSAQAVG